LRYTREYLIWHVDVDGSVSSHSAGALRGLTVLAMLLSVKSASNAIPPRPTGLYALTELGALERAGQPGTVAGLQPCQPSSPLQPIPVMTGFTDVSTRSARLKCEEWKGTEDNGERVYLAGMLLMKE
jgi:hypothetical protein